MSTFQERFSSSYDAEVLRRKDNGEPHLSKTMVWKAANASSGAFTQWYTGAADMKLENCFLVAPLLRVNPFWLFEESRKKDEPWEGVLIQARPILAYNSLDELPSETTVLITQVDVEASAGNGRKNYEIIEKEPLPFQSDFIKKIKASPKNLFAVKVTGGSMEPRLFDGDTVVIDKKDTRIPTSGGIFAIVYGGELLIKRATVLPNGIRVESDNEAEGPSFDLFDDKVNDVVIVGRVKYRSGMGDF